MNYDNVKWNIPIEEVWDYFQANIEELRKNTAVVCEYSFDDADTKWWLLAETNCNDNSLLLSIENSETIIGSSVCASYESTVATIEALLAAVI